MNREALEALAVGRAQPYLRSAKIHGGCVHIGAVSPVITIDTMDQARTTLWTGRSAESPYGESVLENARRIGVTIRDHRT